MCARNVPHMHKKHVFFRKHALYAFDGRKGKKRERLLGIYLLLLLLKTFHSDKLRVG